jgi:SnoaL-like domain
MDVRKNDARGIRSCVEQRGRGFSHQLLPEDGVYHASVGPDDLAKVILAKSKIRRGVQAFFDRFPGGKFENLKVAVAGDIGTFEWDFVSTDPTGQIVRTAGCDLLQFVGDKVAVKNAIRKQRA